MRLLDPTVLPVQLWLSESGVLQIPELLADSYVEVVRDRGLMALSEGRSPGAGPVGGITQERTDQHFAQAFDSSVARVQLALLDPYSQLGATSDALIRVLTADRLALIDAPCGAGAASLSLLSVMAELRKQRVVPRNPISVRLMGAEISTPARNYMMRMCADVHDGLEQQAIFVEHECCEWDALDDVSNTDLIQKLVELCADGRPCCLVVANFSAFLEKERKRREAQPQIEELMRHASRRGGCVAWIEPNSNVATQPGGLLPWLGSQIVGRWKNWFHLDGEPGEVVQHRTSSARYRRVLNAAEEPNVRVAVLRCDFRSK